MSHAAAYFLTESTGCSAKSTVLTSSGIEQIHDAISDLSGITDVLGQELGVPTGEPRNKTEEIIDYLREFKVLIALDNVETILNKSVIDFVKKSQFHCKIAITSRIGLGELEFRWELDKMKEREASNLFIAHAKMRQQDHLLRLTDSKRQKILSQLHHNPLAIRWYVQSIQSGRSPIGENDQGECAVDVSLIENTSSDEQSNFGRVLSYFSDKDFAFIECDDGSRFYFNKNNLGLGVRWGDVKNGTLVGFSFGNNRGGVCADNVAPVKQ